MKILRLAYDSIAPAVAVAKYDKKGEKRKLRFMLMHGSFGKDTWGVSFHLTNNLGTPKVKDEKLELKDKLYTFKTVIDKKKNAPYTDGKGNKLYIVSNSKEYDNLDNDQIVLWSIPVGIYEDVKYTIKGNVDVISDAISGKWILDKFYTAPAPVLSIYGDCRLSWDAKDVRKGKAYSQEITYDEKNGWNIHPVKETKLEE